MIKPRNIHVIQKDNRYVVFHPESLNLISVTDDIGRLLRLYEINSKYITPKAKVAINNILNYLSEKIEFDSAKDLKWENSKLSILNLLISQDCNLRCGYCYADHGTYGSKKKLMSYDTAKTCVDKLFSKESNNHIVFFGGEPFLNFSLIKNLDIYLKRKNLSATYSTITNGTIMNDEIKNFINEKFLNLWISLDGPKNLNDMQRFGLSESVYNRVVETINKLHPRCYPIIIKSVVAKRNINKLKEIVEHISSLNIDSMAIKPASDVPPESDFFMSDEEYAFYINELANILVNNINKLANGEKVKLMSYISPILMQMITKTRKINRCSAGQELLTITADGDVYPCEKYIGLKEFHMGNVHNDDFPGEKFKRLREVFYKINIYESLECKDCWARFLCGGVCHWRSYTTHGDLSLPVEQRCLEMKTILEALLPEIADIFQDDKKTKNLLISMNLIKRNEITQKLIC